jgi:diketogulonate reductase-like aldo/keto reductase
MEMKEFGDTGRKIPAIGIGSWKLGQNPEAEEEAIRQGIRHGMRFVDTAEMYGTEDIVGQAIKGEKDVFVATKVSPDHLHYNDLIKACESSLKRLGIKPIDLYQVHWPNTSIPIDETMRAMEELVRQGKIRYIGVSNFTIQEMEEAQDALKENDIASNQIEYSLLVRVAEAEMLDYYRKAHVTVIAYSPFGRGKMFDNAKYPELLKLLSEIGERHGKNASQIALSYLISHEPVVAIPKAASPGHALENADAGDLKLTKKEMGMIVEVLERNGYALPPTARFFTPFVKRTASVWGKMVRHTNLLWQKRRKSQAE